MKRLTILILTLTLLLCGCLPGTEKSTGSNARIVTQVQVELMPDDGEPFRVYTSEESIRMVLDYISVLDGDESPRRPPEDDMGAWRVTCVYASGEEKHYYLRDGKYFREGEGSWLQIEDVETTLIQLMLGLPSDDPGSGGAAVTLDDPAAGQNGEQDDEFKIPSTE